MISKIIICAVRAATLALATPALCAAAHATPMKMDKDGNLVVADGGFARNSLRCGDQWMNINSAGISENENSFTVEYSYSGQTPPVFKDLTHAAAEFIDGDHDIKAAQIKCLPTEHKMGIFVPSTAPDVEALYLIVLKDGRIIDGYDLSGHDYTALGD